MESVDFFLGLTRARFKNISQLNKNSELFQALSRLTPSSDSSNAGATPVRPTYPLSEPQTRWLALTAFVTAFQRKHTAWIPLLARLRSSLHQLEAGDATAMPAAVNCKPATVRAEVLAVSETYRRFIRSQSAPVFDSIIY